MRNHWPSSLAKTNRVLLVGKSTVDPVLSGMSCLPGASRWRTKWLLVPYHTPSGLSLHHVSNICSAAARCIKKFSVAGGNFFCLSCSRFKVGLSRSPVSWLSEDRIDRISLVFTQISCREERSECKQSWSALLPTWPPNDLTTPAGIISFLILQVEYFPSHKPRTRES